MEASFSAYFASSAFLWSLLALLFLAFSSSSLAWASALKFDLDSLADNASFATAPLLEVLGACTVFSAPCAALLLLLSFDGLASFGLILGCSLSVPRAAASSFDGVSNPKGFLFCFSSAFGGLADFFVCSPLVFSYAFGATAFATSAFCLVARPDLVAGSGSFFTGRSFLAGAGSGTVAGVLVLFDGAGTSAFALVDFICSVAAGSALVPLLLLLVDMTSASALLFENFDFDWTSVTFLDARADLLEAVTGSVFDGWSLSFLVDFSLFGASCFAAALALDTSAGLSLTTGFCWAAGFPAPAAALDDLLALLGCSGSAALGSLAFVFFAGDSGLSYFDLNCCLVALG